MKRLLGVFVAVVGIVALGGAAITWSHGGHGGGWGEGMGQGRMGRHSAMQTATQITDEKAKELAQQYADKYLADFTVERVLPFTGAHHTMYSVELKSSQGELRTLHVTPFGGVMPFGPHQTHR